jgi:hypothetical protein
VTIPPGLAAELALLTDALDLPDVGVAETLTRLATDARSAVESYLGLSVAIAAHETTFDLIFLNADARPEQITTSLLVPLAGAADGGDPRVGKTSVEASIALILYAASPGAFVDLAADLAWITGRPAGDFALDQHRSLPPNSTARFTDLSSINQALGVLIERGSTPEQAERQLAARAATAGIELAAAAVLILAALTPPFHPDAG